MPSSPPKKNTAFTFYVGLVSQANTKILQVSPTLAADDVKVAIDDGAPNNLATLPVVDADFTKRVKVALSAGEMNGDRISIIFADAAGAEWCDLIIDIATSVRQVDDLAFPVVSGRGIDVDATGGAEITANQAVNVAQWNGSAVAAPTVAGVPEVDVTHWLGTAAATPTVAGVPEVDVTHLGGAAQSATDLKDFADEGYDPATNKVQGVVLTDTLTTYTGNTPQTGDSFARLGAPGGASVSADVAAVQADTDNLQTRIPAALVSGRIDASVGAMAADVMTAAALAADTVTEIQSGLATSAALATVQSDTDDIQTRLPAALVGGRMDSSVGAVAANAITAAGIATGAIDADALAQDAAEKIIKAASGTADSGSTTTIVDAERTEADTDYWAGSIVVMTSGPAVGQARRISAFDPATDTLTVASAFTQAVAAGHTYIILRSAALEAPGAGATDWSAGERNQIRDALGVDGTKVAATGGQLQTIGGQTDDIGVAGAGLTAVPWNAAWDAQVESEVDDALVVHNLDHIAGTATGIPAIPAGTYLDQMMDDGAAVYDRATDSLQAIRDRGDVAWITGGGGSITDILNVVPNIPISIDLANTASWRLGLMLTNAIDDLPTTAEITPGTISIDRKAIGATSWTAIVTDAACSEAAGLVYFDEVFDVGTGYAEGDSIRITFKGQKITVATNDFEVTDATGRSFYTEIRQTERGTNGAALAATAVSNADYTGARAAKLDNADVATSTRAAPGDLMGLNAAGLAADAVTEIQSGLATAAALSTAQADLDDIQTRLPTALVGGRMNSDAVAISGSAPAADKLELGALSMETGAAVTGTLSTMEMTTDLTEATDDHYNGRTLIWTGGALLRQATAITDYVGASKKLVFVAVTEAPIAGDTFIIV